MFVHKSHCSRSLRRHLTSLHHASSPPITPLPPHPPPTGHALLTTRRLIAVSGDDAPRFLHGLTTTKIPSSSRSGFYSVFLNAAGRVLHDVFIYPTAHSPHYREWLNGSREGDGDTGFLIEVDAAQVQTLAAHLKKFKLRAQVRIRVVEEGEWGVWSAWGGDAGRRIVPLYSPPSTTVDADVLTEIGCYDRRAPGMGYRVVLPGENTRSTAKVGEEVSVGSYEVRRILRGVAEGQAEIVRETALPLESNMDYMGGIDFHKGCYVGQELTIRTLHTGVVRKRILPVQLEALDDGAGVFLPSPPGLEYYPAGGGGEGGGGRGELQPPALPLALPPRGANIVRADGHGRSAGRWLGGVGNIGLALCRLEVMTGVPPTGPFFNGPKVIIRKCNIVWEEPAEAKGTGKLEGEGGREGEGGIMSMTRKKEIRVTASIPRWHSGDNDHDFPD